MESERNLGTADRIVRVLLGSLFTVVGSLVLAGLVAGPSTALAAVATAVGVVLFATGLVGNCPLYRVVGVDSCSASSGTFPP